MLGDTVVLKRVLIPCVGLMRVKCEDSDEKKSGLKCRPSELPFYCERVAPPNSTPISDTVSTEPTEFEKKTSQVRQELFNSAEVITNYVTSVTDKVNLDVVKEWTSYLQEEENMAPRAGAIAMGGLTGLIFGLRGGLFRKAFYTTTGTLAMTAVCYPKTTAIYSHMVIDDTKRYLTIAYNFVYGVKPGDPQKELPSLPTIPTTLSEVWSLTSELGRSAKSLITGEATEAPDLTAKVILTNLNNVVDTGGDKPDAASSNASCTQCDFNPDQFPASPSFQSCNNPSSTDSNQQTKQSERDEIKSKNAPNDIKSKLEETTCNE